MAKLSVKSFRVQVVGEEVEVAISSEQDKNHNYTIYKDSRHPDAQEIARHLQTGLAKAIATSKKVEIVDFLERRYVFINVPISYHSDQYTARKHTGKQTNEKAMSLDFLRTPFEKANYLASALSSRASGGTADNDEYCALRQELLSIPGIEDRVPSFVRNNRDLTSFWHFIQSKFKTYAERRTFISEQFTPLLDFLEFGRDNDDASPKPKTMKQQNVQAVTEMVATNAPVARNKRKVFIVHGRDNEAKQEVARFLSGLGLEPIILHEQASAGMTIIEKIERYANDADFALVLYTPCDQGRGMHESEAPARNRARQNVVFEHGYLMAKLGRENVCALVKGEIETPNDISGVVYVSLDGYGGWKIAVTKELQACGYEIKGVA